MRPFPLSIRELFCYITQSRYSCVKWIYVYCKKAALFLPAIGADVVGAEAMKNQIRIAVLDDDVKEIHKMEQMISAYEEMHPVHEYIVACHTEVKTFMEAICNGADTAEWAYDILLMDIYLPDGNGIKCGKILRERGFEGVIIYKSSTSENCLEAFAVDALQYLIKPVSEEKLFETLNEAIKRVMEIEQIATESLIYPDDSGISMQAKEEKRRKSIKEFALGWFQRDS